jgi:hypothetical protein
VNSFRDEATRRTDTQYLHIKRSFHNYVQTSRRLNFCTNSEVPSATPIFTINISIVTASGSGGIRLHAPTHSPTSTDVPYRDTEIKRAEPTERRGLGAWKNDTLGITQRVLRFLDTFTTDYNSHVTPKKVGSLPPRHGITFTTTDNSPLSDSRLTGMWINRGSPILPH